MISNNVPLYRFRQAGAVETTNDVQSVAQQSLNIQATSKDSDQTVHMHRLI